MTEQRSMKDLSRKEQDDLHLRIADLERTIHRQQAELDSLKENLHLFESIVKSAKDLIVILEPDLTISFINPTAAKYAEDHFGWPRENIVGQSVLNLLTPNNFGNFSMLAEQIDTTRRLLETGDAAYLETCLTQHDQELWLGLWLIPLRKNASDIYCLIAMGRDVTHRKEAEKQLRRSEERLRTVVSSAPISLWVVDQERRIVFIAGNALKKMGIDASKVSGRYTADLFPKEHAQIEQYVPLLRAGQDVVITSEHNDAVMESRLSIIEDNTGKAVELVGVTTDITERVIAERTLNAEKERLAVTLASIGDAVITTDNEQHIVTLNKEAEKLTGWSEKEALGLPIHKVLQLIDPETGEDELRPLVDAISEGHSDPRVNYDKLLVNRNGKETLVSDTRAPIKRSSGQTIGSVFVFRNISHQRALEQEQHRVQKLESIGLLAGGIAHDFNNILTAIMGNISIAERRFYDRNGVLTRLQEASRAVLRARDLTSQLLTFSQGGAPIRTLSSLKNIIEESAEFSLTGSPNRCLILIPDDLWSVEVDESQISQVIQNLVINADQSMPGGGTVTISAMNFDSSDKDRFPLARSQYVVISVRDQGTGIPDEIVDRIFDPYFTTKKGGTGLGLATAHSIVRQHRGHIRVESNTNKGTTFSVYLPATTRKPACTPETKKTSVYGQGRVLVMDDEAAIRDVAFEILSDSGYDVELATDGQSAVELYEHRLKDGQCFDAVILDLTVPGGLGGKETIRKIRTINPQAKVIVSSGYSHDPVLAEYSEYGFSGIVIKPYDIKQLVSTLNNVLHLP